MLLAIASCLLGACAGALSSFQPAHIGKKGQVRAEAGMDVSVPLGTFSDVIDGAKALASAANERELTDAERTEVLEAGASIALAPPGVVTHVGGTYVPLDHLEIGLRTAGGGWRAGARYQLLSQERHKLDLSAGVAVSRFAYEFPVSDIIGIVSLDDFTRYGLEIPITVGQHGSWYRWWMGPRLMFDRFSSQLTYSQPPVGSLPASETVASIKGTSSLLGAQGGVALGFRKVFIAVEFTAVNLDSNATMTLLSNKQDVDVGGLVIYPGIAIMGEI